MTPDDLLPTLTASMLTALAVFAFVSSITPGPNNTMLLASGANFGFRATIPHLTGVVLGFVGLLLAAGAGLGGLFTAYPALHTVLQVVGAAYLLYLAARIAMSGGPKTGAAGARPLSFGQAAAFQLVNPKGWAMALGTATAYVPAQGYAGNLLVAALVFGLINTPCVMAWTLFGLGLRRWLDRPRIMRGFNIAMALLLVASLIPSLLELTRALRA